MNETITRSLPGPRVMMFRQKSMEMGRSLSCDPNSFFRREQNCASQPSARMIAKQSLQ